MDETTDNVLKKKMFLWDSKHSGISCVLLCVLSCLADVHRK